MSEYNKDEWTVDPQSLEPREPSSYSMHELAEMADEQYGFQERMRALRRKEPLAGVSDGERTAFKFAPGGTHDPIGPIEPKRVEKKTYPVAPLIKSWRRYPKGEIIPPEPCSVCGELCEFTYHRDWHTRKVTHFGCLTRKK